MDQWDPREEDYQSDFNSYDRGPGRNLSKNKKDGITLYVTGIPNEVTEEGLYNLFSQCGNCLSTRKCQSKQKDSGDTFGFVTMGSQKEAVAAMKEFNNFQINKFKMRVRIALDEETLKKRNQQKLEDEEFINSLPSTKKERARKNKLKSVTRTIENDKQSFSDAECYSDRKHSKKKATSTLMNGHGDGIPKLQEIQNMEDSGQWNKIIKSGKYKQGIMGAAPVGAGYPDDRGQRLPHSLHAFQTSRHADSDIEEMFMDPSLLHVERTPQRNDFSPEIFHSYGRGQGILGPAPNTGILGVAPNMGMPMVQTWQQTSDFSSGGYYYGGEHSVNSYGGGYGRGRPPHGYNRRGGFLGHRRGGNNYQYNHYSYTYGEFNNYRGRGGGGFRPPFHHGSMESVHDREHRKPLQKVEDKPCLNCSKPGRYQCSECKSPYCSQDCQIDHWSKHKEDCKKIKEEPEKIDMLEEQFEFSVGEDIVQKTKTLVENFTGEKVIIKPKAKETRPPKEKKPELRKPKLQTLQKSQHQEVQNEQTAPQPVSRTPTCSQQAVNTTAPKQNGVVSSVSETKGKTLKPCHIPMNTVTKVIVTEVVSPDEVWVQLLSEQIQAITALGETMKSVYDETNSEVVRHPRVGDVFGCQFSVDGDWYRARVDSVVGKDVSVTYVDFGNREIVSFDKLRLLQDSMTDLPTQAVECRLVNVEPLTGNEWENKAEEMMKSCVPSTITCQALYSMFAVSKSRGKIDITLANDKDEDIGLKLIANGVAKARTNNEESQTKEKKVAVEKKAVVENADAAIVYSTLPKGQDIMVMVMEVESPDEIWIKIADPALLEKAGQFTEELNKMAAANRLRKVAQPVVGCLYTSQFEGSWYRARLDAFKQNNTVLVTYIDFGNKDIVLASSLRELDVEMKSEPFCVVHCFLGGIMPVRPASDWDPTVIAQLKELVPKTEVSGIFYTAVAENEMNNVTIIKLKNLEDQDIATRMIETGLAQKGERVPQVTRPVSPAPKADTKPVKRSQDVEKRAITKKSEPAIVYSTLPKDKDTLVMVMEVESPDEIWIQEADEAIVKRGMKVTKEINILASENQLKEVTDPCVGNMYVAQFDGSWYRARVDGFKDSSAIVTFVDFGNKDVIPVTSMLELNDEHKLVPLCVVHCCLDGIVPLTENGDWDEAAIKKLQEFLPKTNEIGAFYTATVIPQNQMGHVTIVKLKNEIDEDITSRMIETGTVRPGKREPPIYPPMPKVASPVEGAASEIQPIKRSQDVEKRAITKTSEPAIVYSTLPKDKDTLVMVMEIESPDEIWIQEADEAIVKRGMKVTQEINTLASENQLKEVTDPCVGNMYVAQFDGSWYRARVDGFKDNKAIVTFVDYGNKDVVPVTSMLELNDEHKLVPLCVVHCCLDGIVPLTENGDWDEAAIKKLREFLPKTNEIGAFYTATVIPGNQTGHLTIVKLKNDIDEDITIKMIATGTVRPGKREPPMYPPVPKVASPVEGAASEIQPIKRNVTQASSLRSMIDDFQVDQRFFILIIANTSPTEFTIQICSEELIGKFQKFQEDLNIACSSYDSSYRPENVGQLVIGNFDGMWYRAEVLKLSDRTTTVRYIDFGNEEEKEFTSIQCATEECSKLPTQACNCSLVNIKSPQNGIWSDDIMRKFKNLISEADPQPLEAVYKGKHDGVALIDIFDPVAGRSVSTVISQLMSGARPKSPAAVMPKTDKVVPAVKTAVMASEVPMESLPLASKRCAAGVIEIVKFDSFYLQLVDKQEVIAKLQLDLATYCDGVDTPHTPVVGELVCAKYSADNNWYRAEVLSISSEGLYNVLFVDYGNKEDVYPQNMRKIHQSLLTTPKQAVHCQLAGVVHENQMEESFQNFVACMKQTLVHVVTVEFNNEKYSVEMFGEDDLNVNEHFGTKGRKQAASPNIEKELLNNEQEAIRVSSPCQLPSQPLRIERVEQISPPDSGHFNVVITSIENPEEFYCQIADQAAVEKLTLLMQSMMLNCETNASNPDFGPQVGDLCSAQYSGDQRWYRSVVVQVFPDDKAYKVRYVDFGNTEVINKSDIRETSSDFFELPVLAFKCSLEGVMPVQGPTWTTEAGMKLSSYCNVPLLARTVGKTSSGSYLLDLTFVSDEGSINVAESLKTSGVAKTRTAETVVPESSDGEVVDKEALLLQQIAELQKQLQAIKTNKS